MSFLSSNILNCALFAACGNVVVSPLFRWLIFNDNEGQQATGAAVFFPVDSVTLQLDYIVVSRDAQRGGIATRLMTSLQKLAMDEGYRSIRWEVRKENAAAVALYDRLGALPVSPPFIHASRERILFSADAKAQGRRSDPTKVSQCSVRRAHSCDDHAAATALLRDGAEATSSMSFQEFPSHILKETPGDAMFDVLIAEEDGEVVGVVLLALRQSVWEGKRLLLLGLATRLDKRHYGVATKLMESVMHLSKEYGTEAVEWHISEKDSSSVAFFRYYGCEMEREEWLDYEWQLSL